MKLDYQYHLHINYRMVYPDHLIDVFTSVFSFSDVLISVLDGD